jgi:subtilisin-like proprotein convertase family protein
LYTVSSPGTGKNVLTVGASESTRTDESETCLFFPGGADNATDIASFSSRGPTYDGRRKPDLVAPGTNIQGAASRSENFSGQRVCGTYYPPGQTLYAWSSGTSHSTPAVAGAAALTRQWFAHQGWGTPSPAMTKAFLMATPAYINGAGAGGDLPSNAQGYGLLDLGRALDGTPNLRVDQTHVFGATGETYTLSGRIWTNAQPFRVMLAWTDAPGPLLGLPWVNNLDLEVAVDGTLYRGNVFSFDHSIPGGDADFRNNTEAVFLPAGTAGEFSITVRAKGVYGNGVPGNGDFTDQDFALFVYNGTEGGPPPELTVSVSPDSRIVPQGGSESFAVALTSLNGFAGEAVLSLSGLPGGAAGVFSPGTVSVHPGGPEVSTLTVTADATTPPGAYPLTIAATSGTLTRFANAVLNVQLAESPDQVLTYGVLVRGLIRDNSSAPLTSTIAVPDEMTIKSVGVDVHIQHEKRGDLEVWLAGPDGRTVLLHDRTGGWMNDLDTTYDIATRSVQSLAAFDGLNTLGPWTLFARDLVFGDSGILVDWTLVFNGYYTASPTLAIPDDDASGIVSTIDVQAAGTVSNLIVRADITHTFKGDLEVSLTGPDGTTVLLHNRTGWFLDDIDTVYPDQTAPVESLDVFKGKATQGAWSLKVRDLSSFGVGRLNSWEIDFGAPTIPPF